MRVPLIVGFIISTLAGLQSTAANRCVDVFDGGHAGYGTLQIHTSPSYVRGVGLVELGPTEVSMVSKHLNGAARLFESVTQVPQQIQIRAADENAASGLFGVIYLETKLPPADRPALRPAVVVHEFTHLVFYRALRERLSESLGVPGLLLERERVADQVFEAQGQAQSQSKDDRVLTKLLREQKRIQGLIEKRERATKIDANLDRLETQSLEEVFSDFVSALYMNSRSTMSLALISSGPDAWKEAKYRDFGKRVEVANWDEQGDHHLYTPARSYLGQKLGSQLKLSEKQDLVKHVFRALIDELIILTREKSVGITKSPSDLNRRLIDRFRHALES